MMRLVASAASGAGPLGNRMAPTVPVPGRYAVKARHPMHSCYVWCEEERKLMAELMAGTWEPEESFTDLLARCCPEELADEMAGGKPIFTRGHYVGQD